MSQNRRIHKRTSLSLTARQTMRQLRKRSRDSPTRERISGSCWLTNMYEELQERKKRKGVADQNRLRSGYATESTHTLRPSQRYSKFPARTIRMTLRRIAFYEEYEDSSENRFRFRRLWFWAGYMDNWAECIYRERCYGIACTNTHHGWIPLQFLVHSLNDSRHIQLSEKLIP